jgi:geranylgeranyl reductase family protein
MFDGIIVGAGPAGSTAAYHRANQGRSVLVLEKASLLRNKPCGGVSGAIAQWLDFDRTPAISLKANKINYTWKMQDPVKVERDSPMWMVQRDVFDNFLIKQAQKTGAELRDSTEVKEIEFKNSVWEVKTNSEPVSGRYLIAAEGAGGLMTKWLRLKEPKLCLRACLETRSIKGESLNYDFGIIKKGWIWSFPQADGYSLSIAAMGGDKPKDIKNILADYATKCGADVSVTNVREHSMSLWDGIANCGSKMRRWLELRPVSPTPCPVRGFGLPFLAALRSLRRSIELLEVPATPRKQYTQTIAQESATDRVWAGRLAGAFSQFTKKLGLKPLLQWPALISTYCK